MSKKSSSNDEITLSDVIGSSFAVVQHGIDLVVAAGLKSLKNAAESPAKTKKISNKALQSAMSFGRRFVGFLAQTGDSYMKTYEDLKKDQKN